MDERLRNELKNTRDVFGSSTLLDVYNQNPRAAHTLYRDPNAAALYWKVQEYNKTEAWDTLLKLRAEEAHQKLVRHMERNSFNP